MRRSLILILATGVFLTSAAPAAAVARRSFTYTIVAPGYETTLALNRCTPTTWAINTFPPCSEPGGWLRASARGRWLVAAFPSGEGQYGYVVPSQGRFNIYCQFIHYGDLASPLCRRGWIGYARRSGTRWLVYNKRRLVAYTSTAVLGGVAAGAALHYQGGALFSAPF